METSGRLELDDGTRHTAEEWEQAAAAVLRKAGRLAADDPDAGAWERLTTRTLDGIPLVPLGTAAVIADLPALDRPVSARLDGLEGWDIRAAYDEDDASAINRAALVDLDNGVTSLWLRGTTDLAAALRGVLLDVAPIVLDGADPEPFAALLGSVRPAPGTNLGADPVGASLRGTASAEVTPTAALADRLGTLAVVADGTAVHDLGASDGQELGYLLATATHYLRELSATRSVADAARLIELRVAVTDEQFVSIAKVRAVRRLWARVLELSGVDGSGAPVRVHAVTSEPMLSAYDPWVNMLRTTVAAFAAGVGGADAVTVLPFDAPLGLPDGFSRRIARNTSSLLIEESHLGKVADPAGGSFAVERLTADLADVAWTEFGRIEEAGGVPAGLPGLRDRVAEVAGVRERQVAQRARPLTGLTEFPHLDETLPERAAYPAGRPAVHRYGQAFEELRARPVPSRVFLATLGTVAAHTARATFAGNLLAAGGIGVETAGATADVGSLLDRYDGQPVVCLAGHDRDYAAWGAEAVAGLRSAGARHVIVAGAPPRDPEAPTAALFAAADDTCALGVDALAFVTRTREELAS